ncbi:hypothetical protein [Rhizobium leguminosarum]|jgi:hypothetical protein|uniref:hypothetical protein n=1 Tax=Rhizobium leguminosarum TaxID=384 RepID=UPI00103AC1D1|nr:hypothetical protein [Rhizobium leguminosarum]MBY5465302.1 hypothetical protein [Rhizobium leguminosarum]TBZ81441.1 hypothetical protein E0H61_15005 [Rhizobium leguminosarum bv. viciae]
MSGLGGAFKRVFASLVFLLLFQYGSAAADEERSFGLIDRQPGEDATCEALNRAYEKTANTGTYLITVARLNPDGKVTPFGENLITGRILYFRRQGEQWQMEHRNVLTTMDGGAPVFRGCHFVGEEIVSGILTRRYTAAWQRRGLSATANAWVSNATGKWVQAIREFELKGSPFWSTKVFEYYDYDSEKLRVESADLMKFFDLSKHTAE